MKPANDVNPAASVLLARGPGSDEVYLVRRAETLRFFGGFHAFPGGRVCPGDADLLPKGVPLASQRVAAIRELFEETGVLLARREDGGFPASEGLTEGRRELLAEKIPFPDLLARLRLTLRAADLTSAAELVTPSFSTVRFDTAFFVAALPPGQSAEVWPGELSAGEWQSADSVLRTWERGESLVSPPTVSLLEAVRGRPIDELPNRIRPVLERIAAGAIHPIYFSPAVRMIPLHCQGLPPSTHTNAYLVGTGPVYLFDPGPTDPEEQRRLFDVLDEEAAAGRKVTAVVLTHRHPDHVGAASAVARRYGVPVLGHTEAARALARKVEVRGALGEGSRLDLGEAPAGGPWHLEVLHVPGHAPDHLVFFEPRYQLLFAGDMISTLSSIIIAPPEGDLTVYLASLRRLRELPTRLLLPAHGPPTARAAQALDEALAHRARREEQLVQALGDRPVPLKELAAGLYQGLPAALVRFAELQVLAGLQKLRGEGRAEEVAKGAGWRRTAP